MRIYFLSKQSFNVSATLFVKQRIKFYLYYFSEKYYIQGPQKYFNIKIIYITLVKDYYIKFKTILLLYEIFFNNNIIYFLKNTTI